MDLCFLVTVFIVTFIRHSDGLHCFNCANITEGVDCNAVLQCKNDESCYIERTEQGGHTIYSLGCIADQDCPVEHQFSIIGRSTNGHCQKCCHQNGCNKKYCDAQILTVPQTTTRSCADGPGQNCSALASVVKICSHPHQAKDVCRKYCGLCDMVDGAWNQWLGWATCSKTCGLGITARTRQCTAPAPAHGGYMCSGNSTQQRSCFDRDCPVHGEWSLWAQWESCSVSCGSGLRKRHRHCTNPPPSLYGHYCIGDGVEYSLCQETDCGIQTTSKITAPTVSHCDDLLTDCAIANISFGICNNFEAARKSCAKFCGLCGIVDGAWSAWSLWNSCSVTCDHGTVTRTRSCSSPPPLNGGKNCTGNNTESKSCMLRQCPVHGGWSTWDQWESCSSTCGQGITHRGRVCDNPRPDLLGNFCFGDSTQYGLCLIKTCPVNGGWTEWSLWTSCSVTCGHGLKTRQRFCVDPRPANGGLSCVGSPIEQKKCNMTNCPELPGDCSETHGNNGSYYIYPYGIIGLPIKVYCEFTGGSGWTVIQRRLDGSVNFTRSWIEYKMGFGDPNAEYWIGNDVLHQLTGQGHYELKIILKDWDNVTKYADYTTFIVADEAEQYKLAIDGYSGDARDGMAYHNGMNFSTFDRDNDVSSGSLGAGHCAMYFKAGWWYMHCYIANLNGQYLRSNPEQKLGVVSWEPWHGEKYSLKETTMMIKRK